MRRCAVLPALFLIVIMVIAGCSNQQEQKKAERPKATVKELLIGAVLPLTGDAAPWGIPPKKGAQLAADEISQKGNLKIKIDFQDTTCQPARGISAFRQLADVYKIPVVMGAVCSSVTLAIAPVAEKERVVLISPASTSPKISSAGDYIFRVVPSDALRGRIFARYLFKKKGLRKVAILYINNEGGVGNRDSFKNEFTSLGGKVVLEEAYPPQSRDLRAQLTKIKNSNVDGVIAVSYPDDTILIMKQAAELKVGKPFFYQTEAVEDPSVLKQAGAAANGAIYILPAPAEGEAAKAFAQAYEKRYGTKPELFAAEAYDIIHLVVKAAEANGGRLEAEKVRDYLYTVKSYHGASGIISFDSNGDVIKPMAIKIIENGKPRLLEIVGLE